MASRGKEFKASHLKKIGKHYQRKIESHKKWRHFEKIMKWINKP